MGAIARGAGPAAHRSAPFTVIVDPPGVSSGLRSFGIGTFVNFLSDPSGVESAFTRANFERLCRIKASYDPSSFFQVNHKHPASRGHLWQAGRPEGSMKAMTDGGE